MTAPILCPRCLLPLAAALGGRGPRDLQRLRRGGVAVSHIEAPDPRDADAIEAYQAARGKP